MNTCALCGSYTSTPLHCTQMDMQRMDLIFRVWILDIFCESLYICKDTHQICLLSDLLPFRATQFRTSAHAVTTIYR